MKSALFAFFSFLFVMGAVFYLTFGSLGPWLSQIMAEGIRWWTNMLSLLFRSCAVCPAIHSLFIDGVCAGVGSVLSFLPIIAVLFFCLSILESSGYLAYISAKADRPLRKSGLSGLALIPLLTGFGCSVPAVMAAGKLPSQYDRRLTVFLIPFMSCSAKLPIYTSLAPVFFGDKAIFIIGLFYLSGVFCALLILFFLQKLHPHRLTVKRSYFSAYPAQTFRLRKPDLQSALKAVWLNVRDFSRKAFTVILFSSVLIWFLENLDCDLKLTDCPEDSILAVLGQFVLPFFTPLGLTDWRTAASLIAGLSAKEAVVSTLSVMAGSPAGSAAFSFFLRQTFTPLTACVFMTFCLFYVPCAATLATVYKELEGLRYPCIMFLFQLIFAWILSFLLYHFSLLLT